MRTIALLVLVVAFALPAPGRAQEPVPHPPGPIPPSPLAAPLPELPEWSPRLSVHALGGVLTHAIDPAGSRAPALLLGVGYQVDEWARLELELLTSRTTGTLACPIVSGPCHGTDEATRLVTLLYGFRLETATDPLSAYFGAHSGVELDGPYKVFELLAGGKVWLNHRLGIRLEARHRWDHRFLSRPPFTGTALMAGLDLRGDW